MTSPAELSDHDLALIERSTQELGRAILERCRQQRPSILQRRWWDDRIMAWAMQDESVKVQMFRFIDVLPMLDGSDSIVRHLQEYFQEVQNRLPTAVRLGLAAASARSIAGRALALAARRNALGHARRFIAGTNSAEVLSAAMRERKQRRAFTLDVLGEAVASEHEADRYLQAYLDLVRSIAPTVNSWPEVAQIDRAGVEAVPRVNVSVKLSALDSQFDPIDPEGTTRRVAGRLRILLRLARQHGAHVHVDMESYRTKSLTLAIFQEVLAEEEFRATSDVGIVIQSYLRDAEADLVGLAKWAGERGTPVWVRLVKGAYWDYETVQARSAGWPVPVFELKWQSDESFERASRYLMRHAGLLRPALGSHNVRSLAYGMAVARHVGLPPTSLEVQMLYGMADEQKQAIVDLGYRLRIYMPYGELIPGMAYLVRRLLENTSNDSFLRASFSTDTSLEDLLMNPIDRAAEAKTAEPAAPSVAPAQPLQEFQNEPLVDFSLEPNRRAMRAALDAVQGQLGRSWLLVIGGVPVDTAESIQSVNPSHRRQVVGVAASAGVEEAKAAVAAASRQATAWASLGAQRRGDLLRGVADRLRDQRFELAAWITYESGKSWREADGDVAEAIDFFRYYADGAVAIEQPRGRDLPGEENQFDYLPRGVTAVIAPWNFPLAILSGMTAAALAVGNTVVMKPAEQSPVVAAQLMRVFGEAGFPPGVVNYLPGRGETAGAALVEHPDVAVIAFTGSRLVGLAINARAAEVSMRGGRMVKRVIAEMGGKNAIIVDDDADLDEAVLAVVKSAFGYQGQKCSACSRAIVLARIYDTFLERLVEASRSLKVGPAEDPATSVGPLIDEESVVRVRRYIGLGRQGGREMLAVEVGTLADEGFFVGPHIYADVPPDSPLAQEEVFGPVLAVLKAADLDEAFRLAAGTDYALTGGIFSRSPAHLDRARRELLVGNLYLNRGITGALVGRQPFGGFKMSGIGSQAGGPDYLVQFVVPRTITENTMRRGFAPPPDATQN